MIGPMQSLVPFLIRDELGGGAGSFGVALSAMALGTLTTSTFLTSMGDMKNKGGFFAMALIGGSTCFAVIALSPWLGLALLAFYVWGAFGGFFQAMSQTLLQTHTPDEMMGRVMGVSDGHDAAGCADCGEDGVGVGRTVCGCHRGRNLPYVCNVSVSGGSPFPAVELS